MKKIFVILLFAIISTSLYSQRRGWVPWQMKLYFLDSIYFVKEPLIGLDTAATRGFVRSLSGTGSMVYPDAGIALSSGGAWGASITNNSANWNTAYGWGDHSIAGYAPADSPNFTGTVILPSNTSIGDVSSTEIGYVNGVTSSIQTQLNSKVNVIDTSSMLAPYILDSKVQSDINDTITARLAGGTVGVALADSNKYNGGYATPAWVDANAGGGNADSAKIVTQTMQFITGVTPGAPENGDSIIASSYFEDKNLKLYVNGERKYYNTTTTNTVEGFRFVSDSGIIVKPALATNDQVIVEINDPTYWTTLDFDQDLLDGLVAYYKFDETSGTSLTDEIGGNTATLDGDINQTGIINQAVGLTANNDDIVIPYSEGVTLGESEQFSVSMWFYAEDLPSTIGRAFVLFQQNNSVSPTAPHRASIGSITNKIYFGVYTDAPDDIGVYSADAITADTWHHVVFICPGSGGALQIWVNGVDVSTSAETVNGNLRDGDQYLCVGNAYNAATTAFYGEIDEFAIYNKVLTESEILKLYNSGSGNQYPFE